ncbi:copper chaperone for superoxide dismutase-like [Prorops nasuta]|uniref:copper chaperone for superoxide dismutase-like n=1 Tax=Prorops nasuta TaxID=863751 RepID=UPI0034CDC474
MNTTKIEFAVDMTCQNCVNIIEGSLKNCDGISHMDISLEKGSVVVETNLPYYIVQERIEKTGKKAVLKGYGGTNNSAVAMLGGTSGFSVNKTMQGVIRFIQAESGCILDGTVDGLTPGLHGMHVHECGDISKGCESVGDHFNPNNTLHGGPDDDIDKRHIGDLGNIQVDNNGRAVFKILDRFLQVSDIIGRSLVITEKPDDLGKGNSSDSKINGNSGTKLMCGIIARSSGLFENTKKICACDGLTLWDERNLAVANQSPKLNNVSCKIL